MPIKPLFYCHVLTLAALLAACGQPPELPALAPGDVVLAFGDSLTYGTGAGQQQAYPAVLASLSGLQIINAGVPGEVSAAGLRRLPALLDTHKPKLLILCHGGNDILRKQSLDTAAQNITRMIDLARERDIPVILLGVPKIGLLLSPADIYEQIAEQTDVVYVADLISDVLSDKRLKSDTVHPNAEGYRVMAETLHELLLDADVI